MSLIQPLREKMKEIIPNLPDNWAEIIGDKMGIKADVVRSYVRGDRGKRKKEDIIRIFKFMKEMESELIAEIEELIK